MDPIFYIERTTGQKHKEEVYGESFLRFLYGDGWLTKFFGTPLRHFLSKIPFFSWFYGYLQTLPSSKKKVMPFIKKFDVDPSEFLEKPENYRSFNDFFIRKLKPEARPIDRDPGTAVIPADGRYRFHQSMDKTDGFVIKGERFDLTALLENESLASEYSSGTMVMARLCPTDYHRFHFPCDCIPGETQFINGWLYSVNPVAIKKDIHIFTQNKRTLCELQTKEFGKVLFLEIGATSVGLIHQTYTPHQPYLKGAEKGYFSFGASALILLFPPRSITLSSDLIQESHENLEIRCQMGQLMGTI